jgi:hypothetical protein
MVGLTVGLTAAPMVGPMVEQIAVRMVAPADRTVQSQFD